MQDNYNAGGIESNEKIVYINVIHDCAQETIKTVRTQNTKTLNKRGSMQAFHSKFNS